MSPNFFCSRHKHDKLTVETEEAKSWISECIREDLPSAADFEKTLSNGVYLAKVGHFCAPHVVPYDKIFDINQESCWGPNLYPQMK